MTALSVLDRGPGDARGAGRQEAAPLLIHIGFHKTGSTWLQQCLFGDAARGFSSLSDTPRHALVERFVLPDPLGYDGAAMAAQYRPAIDAAHAERRTLVLSHERLSGYPSSGGRDRAMIAERLHATFPQARILMVIREQRALIDSMYRQHITDGGVESVRRFLEPAEPGLCRKPGFTLDFYAFDRLIALYHALFGDRLLVLPVEQLARDPQGFADRIADFCGQPRLPTGAVTRANTRRPMLMQQIQRPLNFLFYHNELSPGALIHIARFHKRYARLRPVFERVSPRWIDRRMSAALRRAIDARVGAHFADSNRRTAALTGIDLRSLGYAVAQ